METKSADLTNVKIVVVSINYLLLNKYIKYFIIYSQLAQILWSWEYWRFFISNPPYLVPTQITQQLYLKAELNLLS